MGLLTVTYKGEKLPIKIVKVNRNLSAPISSNLKKIGIRNGKGFDKKNCIVTAGETDVTKFTCKEPGADR